LGEIEDNPEDLREKIEQEEDKSQFRGIYFNTRGQPYVVGIIDPLTGFT